TLDRSRRGSTLSASVTLAESPFRVPEQPPDATCDRTSIAILQASIEGLIAQNVALASERVSRITAIDGVVVTLFDGLPASASRRAVGIVGSGSGSSDAPSLIKRCAGRSGPSRSSARRARHARRKEAAARGSARLRASLDRRCDQRSVRLQAGTEKRRSNRTEKHEGRRR